MVARFISSFVFLGILFATASPYGAQNYTDQEIACLRVCRDGGKCFGSSGARDNSPRCKKCVSDCARARSEKRSVISLLAHVQRRRNVCEQQRRAAAEELWAKVGDGMKG